MMSAAQRAVERMAQRLAGTILPSQRGADPFSGLTPWELTTFESLEVRKPNERRGSEALPPVDEEYAELMLAFTGVCTIRRAVESPMMRSERLLTSDRATSRVTSRPSGGTHQSPDHSSSSSGGDGGGEVRP